MEAKFNDATPQRPAGERPLDAPLVVANLPALLQQLRGEPAWAGGDRNAITLFKTTGLTITLVALRAGGALDAHIEEGILTLHLLEGRLRLVGGPEGPPATLAAGQLLAVHAGLPYQVVATEAEVVLLLTLAGQVRPPEAGGAPGAA